MTWYHLSNLLGDQKKIISLFLDKERAYCPDQDHLPEELKIRKRVLLRMDIRNLLANQ